MKYIILPKSSCFPNRLEPVTAQFKPFLRLRGAAVEPGQYSFPRTSVKGAARDSPLLQSIAEHCGLETRFAHYVFH